MDILQALWDSIHGRTMPADEGPTHRCLRCGDKFDQEHSSCPTCGARFVAEIDDAQADEERPYETPWN